MNGGFFTRIKFKYPLGLFALDRCLLPMLVSQYTHTPDWCGQFR